MQLVYHARERLQLLEGGAQDAAVLVRLAFLAQGELDSPHRDLDGRAQLMLIVGAEFQSLDSIGHRIAGGDDQDRCLLAGAAQLREYAPAVTLGQHDVQARFLSAKVVRLSWVTCPNVLTRTRVNVRSNAVIKREA